MADTTTPNMNLVQPEVSAAPGPGWATTLNGDLSAIDSHNHTPGQGVQITPAAMDINADLSMGQNSLTTVRSVNFTAQAAPLALAGDLGCIYVSGSDLYYNDEAGNQVRITQSGSVTGSTGTITGLPSGTASASYSAGTFTFQGATSTPATMAVGPVVIGRAVASSKTVSLTPNSGQAADFGLIFPAALPGSTLPLMLDTSGNIASGPATGTGAVVLTASPTLTTPAFAGVPTGTITGAAFTPTVTYTRVSGGTATLTTTASTWYYTRIGNVVSAVGMVTYTVSAYSGSNSVYSISPTIPISTAALDPVGFTANGNSNNFVSGPPVAVSTTGVSLSVTISANGTGFTIRFGYTYAVS